MATIHFKVFREEISEIDRNLTAMSIEAYKQFGAVEAFWRANCPSGYVDDGEKHRPENSNIRLGPRKALFRTPLEAFCRDPKIGV